MKPMQAQEYRDNKHTDYYYRLLSMLWQLIVKGVDCVEGRHQVLH